MKVVKYMLVVNGVTLTINGVIVWLTVVKTFPAILGIVLFLGFMASAVWLSCYMNGALPSQRRSHTFYSAPTERIERL